MINVTFQNDTNTVTSADGLYQWDVGQILRINGLSLSVAPKVHFATKVDETAYVVQSEKSGTTITVGIPDKVLTHGYPIIAYVYLEQGTDKRTIKSITIPVIKRAKPNGWRETNSEDIIEAVNFYEQLTNDLANEMQELRDLLEAIDSSGGGFVGHMTNTNNPHAVTLQQLGAKPNENLLHNWYFGNPVNRNGLTEYSGSKQYIDRWKGKNGQTKIVLHDGYIEFLATSTGYGYFEQEVGYDNTRIVTLSVLMATGEVYYKTGTNPQVSVGGVLVYGTNGNVNIRTSATSTNIIAIKLEYGDTQTLAHQENGVWVLNEIPDYAEQMAICMQYDKSSGAYLGLTPEAVGAIPFFYALSQLGLTQETATVVNIFNAMPRYSKAQFTITSGWLNGEYPVDDLGVLRVEKYNDNRAVFEQVIKNTSYIGFYDGSFRGWKQVFYADGSVAMSGALRGTDGTNTFQYFGEHNYTNYVLPKANAYGTHNITAGTADLTAGTSALTTDCYYDVYK